MAPLLYPTSTLARISSLVHRYDRANGIYRLEMFFGDAISKNEFSYSESPESTIQDIDGSELAADVQRILNQRVKEKLEERG